MARHRSPRGRHALHALPLPTSRHAVGDGARGAAAVSVPVRRGIAVVAVVGGTLSAVGAGAGVAGRLPAPPWGADDAPAVDLASQGQLAIPAPAPVPATVSPVVPAPVPAPLTGATAAAAATGTGVMGTDALAKALRTAGQKSETLAERTRSADRENDRENDDVARPSAERENDDEDADGAGRRTAGGAAPARTGPLSKPSDVIDPNGWSLTLPTGEKGSPDTVDGERLASYDSEFFQLNEARDGVVFTANAGGVTTENSHYPRSELREMDGDKKASWDGRRGKHTMEVVESVRKTPPGKAEVVAAQIHGGEDDLLQIRLDGTVLSVTYADGKKKVVLDDDYQLGKRFRVKIESADGAVKVWHDGTLKADLPISDSTSYFKVGSYVQSNASKGEDSDAEGAVEVCELTVTHSEKE